MVVSSVYFPSNGNAHAHMPLIMSPTSLMLLLLLCSLLAGGRADTISILRTAPGKYQVVPGVHQEAGVTSLFSNTINETGWSLLEVHGATGVPDAELAYMAGYAEGLQTGELIYMEYMNTFGGKPYCGQPSKYCDRLRDFLDKNQQFMSREIARNPDSQFWHQVALYQEQLKGLKDGYFNNTSLPPLPEESFLFLQLEEDLSDLEAAFKAEQKERKPFSHSSHLAEGKIGAGRCSALIKLLPGNTDLYTAHDTWTHYQEMLRVFKLYDLPYKSSQGSGDIVAAPHISMSSYPGKLQSMDDYHLCSSGLVTMETTNDVVNTDLYKDITPECVFEPLRVMVANRLATSGEEWMQTFAMYNSGTYNNQWMVVDYKLFSPGQELPGAGLLWVLEQLPGAIVYADQTRVLAKKTYWASYNIPFYSTIFNLSGLPEEVEKFGDWFTYDGAPRAKIFARNHTCVHDMDSMLALMRYNNFQHDPLSRCDCDPPYSGENGISARSDLNPPNGTYPFDALGHRYHGGTDSKVTSYKMMQELSCMAISGPTYQQQPVFQWSTSGYGSIPLGQPDRFQFHPILIKWSNSSFTTLH